MTFNQKKFLSLGLAIAIVSLASMLTGCGKSDSEKVAEQRAAANKATHEMMKQGDGQKTIRKPGTSGFKSF
jgi:major membrane immunogen (membrane-anchored lipoprotein)